MAKILFKGTPWYIHTTFAVAMLLIIVGFLLPPQGEIDGSVLTGVGELMGGASLLTFVVHIPAYLEAGVKAKFSHGQTAVTIAADEVKDKELDD